MNKFIKSILFLGLTINIFAKIEEKKENNITLDIQETEKINEFKLNEKKFKEFLKNSSETTLIKKFCQRYLCYLQKNIIHIFDLKENILIDVKLNIDKKTKINCFLFDGKNIYLVFEKSLNKFNLNGEFEKKSNHFKDFIANDMQIYNDILYVFSFNHEIYAFLDIKDELKCLWKNHDFCLLDIFEFSYEFFEEKLLLFSKDRLCIINSLNGKILKNIYFLEHFDLMAIKDNKVFLYGNLRNCAIDLKDYSKIFDSKFQIGNKIYEIDIDNTISESLINQFQENKNKEKFLYLNHLFMNDCFIAFHNTEIHSDVFLITNDKKISKKFNWFVIKDIFFYNGKFILIDGKFGKFAVI